MTANEQSRNDTATIAFYRAVPGMQAERFAPADGSARWALKFGTGKINLHAAGTEFEPKAAAPTPGSADLCFTLLGRHFRPFSDFGAQRLHPRLQS